MLLPAWLRSVVSFAIVLLPIILAACGNNGTPAY